MLFCFYQRLTKFSISINMSVRATCLEPDVHLEHDIECVEAVRGLKEDVVMEVPVSAVMTIYHLARMQQVKGE